MSARGDRAPGSTIYDEFNTFTSSTGSLGALSNGVLTISRDGRAAITTTGGSLTMSAGGVVGLNAVCIVTTDAFYTSNSDYAVYLSAGSVGTTSAAGLLVTTFSLGKANVDFLNGTAVTMAAGLLQTNVGTIAAGVTGKVSINDGALTSIAFAADGITRIQTGLVQRSSIALDAAGAIIVGSVTVAAQGVIADGILFRSINGGANDVGAEARSVQNAFRVNRNLTEITAGVLTVYKEDDVTPAWTAAITTTAGNPISKVDPT